MRYLTSRGTRPDIPNNRLAIRRATRQQQSLGTRRRITIRLRPCKAQDIHKRQALDALILFMTLEDSDNVPLRKIDDSDSTVRATDSDEIGGGRYSESRNAAAFRLASKVSKLGGCAGAELEDWLSRLRWIPETDGTVFGGGDEVFPIWQELTTVDSASV